MVRDGLPSLRSLPYAIGAMVLLCAATALASCSAGAPAWPSMASSAADAGSSPSPGAAAEGGPSTNTDSGGCGGAPTLAAIQTGIFSASCAFGSCHGGGHPAAGLDLTAANACSSLVGKSSCDFTTRVRVVPGNPDASYLFQKVSGGDLGTNPDGPCAGQTNGTPARMPLGGTPLCDGQIEQIRQWILAGASCDEDGGADASMPSADSGVASDAPAAETSSPAPDGGQSDAGLPTVLQMTSAVSQINAGQQANATVTLASPAPASGVSVMLTSTDATVLAVPTAVFVTAGQTMGTFAVSGLRPGRASVQANGVSLDEVVVGLSIAEVFYNDTVYSDGEQWVRLYNSTSLTLDLSQYSLGAGTTSYAQTTAQLSGTIAPGACFVVGGPTSNVYNGGPTYSQVLHFLPNIPMGGSTGAGVALFSVPAASIGAGTIPVDALVYGDANTGGLMGPLGTVISPLSADAVAGASLVLQSGAWLDNLAPSPDTCN